MKGALLLCTAAALAATASAGAAIRHADACKAGVHVVGKTVYRVFCGPASASVKIGAKTQSFHHGSCLNAGAANVFTISIGTLAISQGKTRYRYLGLTVPSARRDGVYHRAVVAWAYAGKRYTLYNVTVRLAGKRTRGTFSGRIVGKRETVRGSFHCR